MDGIARDETGDPRVTAMFESIVLRPLFAPLETALGPLASTAFGSMLERLLVRDDTR